MSMYNFPLIYRMSKYYTLYYKTYSILKINNLFSF